MKTLTTKYSPLLFLTVITALSCASVFAVTYWSGTQTSTVNFGEGGEATFQNIALPTAYYLTPTSYTVPNALNVSTYVADTIMVMEQSSSQRTNILNNFDVFTVTVKVAGSGTVVTTWDLRTDLTATIPLSIAGDYGYDYDYSYTGKQSTGSMAIDWTLTLASV